MSLKIAILVSGRGSNMCAILDAIDAGKLNAKVELVFSNNTDAPALAIATKRGIPTAAISHRGIPREHHEQQVLRILSEYEFDFVVLAGYMRVLSANFLRAFKHEKGYFRIINIHPSMLPSFPGTHAYEDAFAYGVRLSGITVHLVDEEVDRGEILAQEAFPRLPGDDLDTFKNRGLAVEHKLFPQVLQEISINGLSLLTPMLDSKEQGNSELSDLPAQSQKEEQQSKQDAANSAKTIQSTSGPRGGSPR